MKVNAPRRTAAQLRRRESELLEELCAHHGYMFSDTLPARDRATMLVTFDRRRSGNKMKLDPGVVLKIAVPDSSAMGSQILKKRKLKERAKARKP